MDMGEALRNTTLVSRPSDMFFLPSTTPDDEDGTAATAGTTGSDVNSGSDVSRGTAQRRAKSSDGTPVAPHSTSTAETRDAGAESASVAVPTAGAKVPDDENATASTREPDTTGTVSAELESAVPTDSVAETGEEVESSAPRVSRETTTRAARQASSPGAAGAGSPARARNASDGPSADDDVPDLATVPGATFAEIPVSAIHPNRKQPRQVFDEEELAELAYSIGELGVLQPIVVRGSREDGEQHYELVMGERRWRATQRAGLATIPAIVRETSDDDLLRDALLENLHRSQLNPLEEAAAYQQLLEEFGTTQEELSRRIGRSRPQISNTIRLLRLPPLVQRRVAAGVLSSGHARALLSLQDPAEMERLAQRIVAEGLSVRATEEAVQLAGPGERPAPRKAAPAGQHKERLDYIAEAFADRLDTSVRIALGARKGKMTIEFASVEDLNRIIEVLDPGMDRS